MPHTNSVLQLRARELAQSRRPFLARGSRAVRCDACLLTQSNCICASKPRVVCRSAVCLLMYKGEVYKPSNTGRLVADVVADNYAFQWQRTEHDPELLALLAHPAYQPIVVFPHEYAVPDRCIHTPRRLPGIQQGKVPLFLLLDGTWREARKMFNSPYLATLPVLGITPEQASLYKLREAAHSHQLCTAEVAIEVLKLADDHAAADALNHYFHVFRERYLAGRANHHGQQAEKLSRHHSL